MAKQVITKLLDDLDGGEADESVTFALDGVNYEIDLSEKNAAELRAAMDKYVSAGARQARTPATAGRIPARANRVAFSNSAANREQNAAIRDWARQNGYDINDRGRIPQDVVDAFTEAHAPKAAPKAAPAPAAPVAAEPVKRATRKAAAPSVNFKPEKVNA